MGYILIINGCLLIGLGIYGLAFYYPAQSKLLKEQRKILDDMERHVKERW